MTKLDLSQTFFSSPARKVIVKKPLLDVETLEKETVTFELELSHPNVLGVWTRDGIRVKPSSTCQMSATGCRHSLTLQRLTLDDTGTVAFTADTVRSCARLTVRGTGPVEGGLQKGNVGAGNNVGESHCDHAQIVTS